jgi:hypothetical protein
MNRLIPIMQNIKYPISFLTGHAIKKPCRQNLIKWLKCGYEKYNINMLTGYRKIAG